MRFDNRHRPGLPLVFKLWFGFVACLALSIIGAVIYFVVSLISLGPDGMARSVGQAVGEGVRAYEQAR